MSTIKGSMKSVLQRFGRRSVEPEPVVQEELLPVKKVAAESKTEVDNYWGEHTVNSKPFRTARESEDYLVWRASVYPKFKELMEHYGEHDDQVILDYGCGPGNDVVGFAIYTKAKKVIGIDVSSKALALANHRLALHEVNPEKIELIHSSDSLSSVPLEDGSVDYIHCAGVLHHTSNPQILLKEFYRVLRPGSRACIMVYNRDSLWFHLYTAYVRMIVQGDFQGLSLTEAFTRNTDGENCPIARCYQPDEFISICQEAGFSCEYAGGYLSDTELQSYRKHHKAALRDKKLADEHKRFISELVFDDEGLPRYQGKYAGIGGVYWLDKD
ncbi:MAG TPA: class I SAM-dependent methyltransferase [Pyrinomonadaceae bacterium]|nr:class I SAM-dependent methyltransferase [Pyrinomonadaceae bacterium]